MAPIADPVLAVAGVVLARICCEFGRSDRPVCRCAYATSNPEPVAGCDCETGTGVDGGEAWLHVGTAYPSTSFPLPAEVWEPCPPSSLAVVLTAGVWRCAPTLDDQGQAPAPAEVAAAITGQWQDRLILTRAVQCALDGLGRQYVIGLWEPQPPLGGRMGGTLAVTVQVDDCAVVCTPCP